MKSTPSASAQVAPRVPLGVRSYLQRQLLDLPEQLNVFLRQVLVAGKLLVVVAPVAAVLIVCKIQTELSELLRRLVQAQGQFSPERNDADQGNTNAAMKIKWAAVFPVGSYPLNFPSATKSVTLIHTNIVHVS